MINKNDAVPIYVQLQRIIREDILKGVYQKDEAIPSETLLSKKYDITRMTVRKAIDSLVEEGLLRRERGKGTFVSLQKVNYNIWNFGGFTDFIKRKNKEPISKILEESYFEKDGESYYKLVRARGVKEEIDKFLTIDISIISLALFPGIDKYDFSRNSIYNIMRTKYDIYPSSVEFGVYPALSNKEREDIFRCSEGELLINVKGNVFDDKGNKIEEVSVVYSPEVEFKMVTKIN